MTAKGAEVFHDACALAADARIAFCEKHLMENVVAAAREVDAWLRAQEKGAHAVQLRDALKELDDYRAGKVALSAGHRVGYGRRGGRGYGQRFRALELSGGGFAWT